MFRVWDLGFMHAVSRTVSKHPLGDKTTVVGITNCHSTIQPVEPP